MQPHADTAGSQSRKQEIFNVRDFVKKLLMDNTFDRFLAMEAFVKSGITYSFDGRVNKDFYDKEELELMASTSYASWESIKPHVYNVIRGKKLQDSARALPAGHHGYA